MAVSLWAGRRERSAEDYFLAGRSLPWWLIGFSLIASNISTEHFVGMAGAAYGRVGLAIASYEWMAAVTLVVVALWLLPHFLRAGIYTMPEFLEYRYDSATRRILAGPFPRLPVGSHTGPGTPCCRRRHRTDRGVSLRALSLNGPAAVRESNGAGELQSRAVSESGPGSGRSARGVTTNLVRKSDTALRQARGERKSGLELYENHRSH